MSSEGKKQKAREKKTKKRQGKRVVALEKRKTAKEIAEYQHWIKFHTDDSEVSPDHAMTPEQLEALDKQRREDYNREVPGYDPRTAPIDVGTTRMKLDTDTEEDTNPNQNSFLTYEEQLRLELGLGFNV